MAYRDLEAKLRAELDELRAERDALAKERAQLSARLARSDRALDAYRRMVEAPAREPRSAAWALAGSGVFLWLGALALVLRGVDGAGSHMMVASSVYSILGALAVWCATGKAGIGVLVTALKIAATFIFSVIVSARSVGRPGWQDTVLFWLVPAFLLALLLVEAYLLSRQEISHHKSLD